MKLTNVHYKYLENDTWRIYFNDYQECEAFQNERSDVKKPMCSACFTNKLGIRYYVEAKLTGRFEQLRQLYKAKGMRDTIVDDLESDGTFDKIDLIFDTERGFATFRIEKFETWTDWACKSILNSQFGMVAQANGYYDTDDAYQGGLCVRRSCCGIGFGEHRSRYGNTEERIIFTVKNFCRGEADIVKVSPWTNTFIGTNKETEKEYSWNDFKQYMQKLSSTGSDIWDIEWKYDETCPMTGTEIADELHLYLKPEAYKRLFEEKEEPKQILKNITDISSCMTKVLGCGTLYYYNLYFDDKSDLKNVDDKYINRSMLNSVKGTYYVRVVSYDKELPKNISSATLVWDQEENRYSVEDFTIRGYRKDDKMVWATEMAKLGADFDGDTVCEYCKRDVDICKEAIAATLKAKNSTAEPHIFFNNKVMTLTEFNAFIKEANNKEEKNMGPKDTTFAEFCRRIYWGTITPVKPERVLIQGTATIIWWSDGTKTIVKCQKGDKMDPEKGTAMCVMKKFMGTNETHSNYLDFAKPAIEEYEAKQKAMTAARKKVADKKRRAAKKEEKENAEV